MVGVQTAGARTAFSVASYEGSERSQNGVFLLLGVALAAFLAITLLVYSGADGNLFAPTLILTFVCLTPMIWRWPQLGVYLLLAAAVLVEHGPLRFGLSTTDQIPVFLNLDAVTGVPGLFLNPAEVLMLLTLGIWLLKQHQSEGVTVRGGPLFLPFSFFMGIVLLGVLRGIIGGGDWNYTPNSVQALVFMYFTYLLTVNLVRSPGQVRVLLSILIGGVAIKGLIALWRYYVDLGADLTRIDSMSGVNSLMAHSESFFFLAILFLALVHLVYGGLGRQGRLSLAVLPVVIVPFLANQRRVGTAALLLALVVLLLLTYSLLRERRRLVLGLLVIGALVVSLYGVASWNSGALVAEPVQAVKSGISPDPQDRSSNDYREEEDANLKFTALQNPLVGIGFGKPMIIHRPMPDLSDTWPRYTFEPHNGPLWLLMATGVLGSLAFWYLMGTAIVRAVAAARQSQDQTCRSVVVFGLLTLVVFLVWALFDMGLMNDRLGIFAGVQMGLMVMAPVLFGKQRLNEGGSA